MTMAAHLFLPLNSLSLPVPLFRPQQTIASYYSCFSVPPSYIALPLFPKFREVRCTTFCVGFPTICTPRSRPRMKPPAAVSLSMLSESSVVRDICATVLSSGIALSLLRLWEETARRGIVDQNLNRKLVHVTTGLVFMLCWPLFSSGLGGALMAALIPVVNIIRMLLLGLGLWKDEATVKSMSRYGDYRELLRGPLYYASTIGLACAIYWRTSPIGIAAVCNLCAGDGLADIVGRRFGSQKLPYNREKSIAGTIAMVSAGFLASVWFIYYFSLFGYIEVSWKMIVGFFIVSLVSALVESHPISTKLDDNLTVTLTSLLVGSVVF